MRYNVIRPESREQWLEVRKNGIGSSEAATIMGLNPFETPYQLWMRKKGYTPPTEENFAMKAGHYLEDAVSQFYADATASTIIKRSAIDWIAQDKDKPFMQVSPDRTMWEAGAQHTEANKGIVECKTTQRQIDETDLPRHWYIQLQYQLHVTGYRFGSLAWLTQGRTFGWRRFERDDELGRLIEKAVTEFWERNIIGGEEPRLTAASDYDIKWPVPTMGKSVEVDEYIYRTWKSLVQLKEGIAELEATKRRMEETIRKSFGDAEAIEWQGHTLATYKAPKPSATFDWRKYEADHPDAVAGYITEKQGARRLLIKSANF